MAGMRVAKEVAMTSGNALSFLFLSVLMVVAPTLAPGWFPPTGFDGTNARAMWLLLMGVVNAGIGSTFLVARYVLPAVQSLAAFRPQLPQLQTQSARLPSGAAQGSVV